MMHDICAQENDNGCFLCFSCFTGRCCGIGVVISYAPFVLNPLFQEHLFSLASLFFILIGMFISNVVSHVMNP